MIPQINEIFNFTSELRFKIYCFCMTFLSFSMYNKSKELRYFDFIVIVDFSLTLKNNPMLFRKDIFSASSTLFIPFNSFTNLIFSSLVYSHDKCPLYISPKKQ